MGITDGFASQEEQAVAAADSIFGYTQVMQGLLGMKPEESIGLLSDSYEQLNFASRRASEWTNYFGGQIVQLTKDAGDAGMSVDKWRQSVISTTQSTAFYGTQLEEVSELMKRVAEQGGKFRGISGQVAQDVVGVKKLDTGTLTLVGNMGKARKVAQEWLNEIDKLRDEGKLNLVSDEDIERYSQLQKLLEQRGPFTGAYIMKALPIPQLMQVIQNYLGQSVDQLDEGAVNYEFAAEKLKKAGIQGYEGFLSAVKEMKHTAQANHQTMTQYLSVNRTEQDKLGGLLGDMGIAQNESLSWQDKFQLLLEKWLAPIIKGVTFMARIAERTYTSAKYKGLAPGGGFGEYMGAEEIFAARLAEKKKAAKAAAGIEETPEEAGYGTGKSGAGQKAYLRSLKKKKDVLEVLQSGLVNLSQGDVVVDRDSLGRALGGTRGSAVASLGASAGGSSVSIGNISVNMGSTNEFALGTAMDRVKDSVIQEYRRRQYNAASGIGKGR
jgi:hypothetical protein